MQKPGSRRWAARAAGAALCAWLGVAAVAVLVPGARALAATLPQSAPDKHLGVASCASGVCHGSVQGLEVAHVLQNEYVTWTQQDKHATAYQTLLSERSRQIARNLGLANPHEAGICLDCHADNVPQARWATSSRSTMASAVKPATAARNAGSHRTRPMRSTSRTSN